MILDSYKLLIKILVENSMNQSASNSNIESTLARAKLPTKWSNNEPNSTNQLQNFHENQTTKESGISVARNHLFEHFRDQGSKYIIVIILLLLLLLFLLLLCCCCCYYYYSFIQCGRNQHTDITCFANIWHNKSKDACGDDSY